MLFSDNVPVESELALKLYARERDLMVMGPDCGTAIVGGVPLGFANAVRRGAIGVVGASGAGTQEVTVRIHQLGQGVLTPSGRAGTTCRRRSAASPCCMGSPRSTPTRRRR